MKIQSDLHSIEDLDKNRTESNWLLTTFILQHPFEVLAIGFTVIGTFGYAAGASFIDGWNHAAGVSSSLFQTGLYETILKGLSLDTPWRYSAIALVVVCVEIWLLNCLAAWQARRNSLIRIRRKTYETRKQRNFRLLLAHAARKERNIVPTQERRNGVAYKKWKELGKRGNWIAVASSKKRSFSRNRQYIESTVYLFLQIFSIFMIGMFYVVAKTFIVKQANSEGVRQFVSLYSAVTGNLPSQFGKEGLTREQLLDFACRGYSELWKYRAANLSTWKSTISSDKESTYYVLQSTDKLFLLLSGEGTVIHSFGDNAFTLKEAQMRPVSELVKLCQK